MSKDLTSTHTDNADPNWKGMRICVLQPDYSTSNVDYKLYDPPRDLSRLIPEASFEHVFLNKLTTYRQLKSLQQQGFDVFVNLCEGYLEWEVPSIEVIWFLEQLNLPFTGPSSRLYDPPKELMKYVACTAGIATPEYVLLENLENPEDQCRLLKYPLFVKPHKSGDSLGIDKSSLVQNSIELRQKAAEIMDDYGPLLAEEYISGREFTVMLAAPAESGETVHTFRPVEYIFPEGYQFKTYALKTAELHPGANVPVTDTALCKRLQDAATAIFNAFSGVGYARLDFRMDSAGKLYFLEINFTCSVFYRDGYEGSADYILQHDGTGQAAFLRHIIKEGLHRHRQQQKKYVMKGSPIAGYGIYALVDIAEGGVVYNGEGRPQRMVTLRHVQRHWTEQQQLLFRQYAYPVSPSVFLLWDDNPQEWAPQNHHCDANTAYDGLNVVATRPIRAGEELTLNYSQFLDEHMEPFTCSCGAPNCLGSISGKPGNSVTEREAGQK
jgi:D-alanine-D-alanine ligase-like ATP-grasp enzyme